jgi:hypothetical protein
MKSKFLSFIVLFLFFGNASVDAQIKRINIELNSLESEAHLRFLTADELRGRNTGTIELNIVGRYIAEQFRRYGVSPLGDADDDYLQKVPLYNVSPPATVELQIDDKKYTFISDMAYNKGSVGDYEGSLVYIENLEEIESIDLEGKFLIMVLRDIRQAMVNQDRVKLIESKGAIGLIEIYGPGQQFPWPAVANYLSREKMIVGEMKETKSIPHILITDPSDVLIMKLKENPSDLQAILKIDGLMKKEIEAYNVVGKVEGTDPELKKEHIIMCAHYDHVGIQEGNGQDSIYNGTRDNGIGTTGILNAAQYFGQHPPKRSIILIALTGEEKGLLGSQYYTTDPKIPLEETVFAFNIDNSGYTNTEVITLLDTARTNIDALVYQAADEVGLGVIGDRIPAQNYYERSDQVSFAIKGVPAVNFKMSMEAFDERISKYYHQPNDEFDTVDLEYIHKYWKAYIRSAELIGNWDQRPYWIEGDKFEEAGNKLYKMD